LNGKWIAGLCALLSIILSVEVLPAFIISEIFWLEAMAFILLYGFWDQLGKKPPDDEKSQDTQSHI
jgi:hypothetical protein